MLKLYSAHPISGLSYDQVVGYYKFIQTTLGGQLDILCPMTGKGELRTEKRFRAHSYQIPQSTNHAIVERDHWMVTLADIVLVDLTGAEAISIGCMMELAWAHQLRKHTIVVMEPDNIHQHAFVIECADILLPTIGEALTYLTTLINGTI